MVCLMADCRSITRGMDGSVKDRRCDEDRHWTRRPGLAAVFASLTNAAISVLQLLPDSEPILRAKTEKFQWNPNAAVKLLGF